MEKMASRKVSPLHITHRRMVVSMPNLQDISLPELPPRNSSLRIMDTSSSKSSSPGRSSRYPPACALPALKPTDRSLVQGQGMCLRV